MPALDRRQWMPRHGGRLCWVSLRTSERFRGSVGRGGCGGRSLSSVEMLGVREVLEAGWAVLRTTWSGDEGEMAFVFPVRVLLCTMTGYAAKALQAAG